jgi:hypothetical protein
VFCLFIVGFYPERPLVVFCLFIVGFYPERPLVVFCLFIVGFYPERPLGVQIETKQYTKAKQKRVDDLGRNTQ